MQSPNPRVRSLQNAHRGRGIRSPSIYKNKKKKRKALQQKVVDQAPEDAVRAVVVYDLTLFLPTCANHSSNAPHTSRNDKSEHSTVDYIWPADENGEERKER
jgi:hypothetical protein